jgi:hypothetical protein
VNSSIDLPNLFTCMHSEAVRCIPGIGDADIDHLRFCAKPFLSSTFVSNCIDQTFILKSRSDMGSSD